MPDNLKMRYDPRECPEGADPLQHGYAKFTELKRKRAAELEARALAMDNPTAREHLLAEADRLSRSAIEGARRVGTMPNRTTMRGESCIQIRDIATPQE